MSMAASPFAREQAEALVASRPWWYHRFEIFPTVFTPGVYDPSGVLTALELPQELRGQRLLEIGPADGYFTKQMTLRGASVTAFDYAAKDFFGFAIMEKLHGAEFDFVQGNLLDLPKFGFQPFDLVLCMGVLYHLPDMIKGLHLLRDVCAGRLILETLVATDLGDEPRARYHPAASLNNDPTNFWSPNVACVQSMLADVGFILERHRIFGQDRSSGRAAFWCRTNSAGLEPTKTDIAYSQPGGSTA
jgi:tRNA (mo5U34)-methyltransferase